MGLVEVGEDGTERKSHRSEEHPRRIILHSSDHNNSISMWVLANTCDGDSDQTTQMRTNEA